jgi:hypothetical protein
MGNKPRGARGGLIHKAFCWFLRRSWPNHSLPPAMRQWRSPGPTSVAAPAGALDALSRTSSPEAQSVEGVPPFQASWIFVHRSSKRVKRSDLVLSSGKSPAATINSVGIKNPLGKASDVQYIASPLKKTRESRVSQNLHGRSSCAWLKQWFLVHTLFLKTNSSDCYNHFCWLHLLKYWYILCG